MSFWEQAKQAIAEETKKHTASKDEKLAEARQAKYERIDRDVNPLRRFEYKAVWARKGAQKGAWGGGEIEDELNKLGMKGWDLVAVAGEKMILKREL